MMPPRWTRADALSHDQALTNLNRAGGAKASAVTALDLGVGPWRSRRRVLGELGRDWSRADSGAVAQA